MTEQQNSPLATEEPEKPNTSVRLFNQNDVEHQRFLAALFKAEEEKDEDEDEEDEDEDEEDEDEDEEGEF